MKTPDTESQLHMKALAKAECAKDAGEFTVVRLGYVVSLMKEVQDERDTYWDKHEQKMYEEVEKAHKELLEERDAYWKERIEEIIKMADALELECGKDGDKGTKQWMAFKGFRNTIRDRFLTNKDNLK